MSTNNFSFENICVIVHDDTEEDDGEFRFDMDMEFWREQLASEIKGFIPATKREWTKNEALIIGEITMHKPNGEYYASIYATYKSGYYAGACLDYVVEYEEYLEDDAHLKTLDAKIEARTKKLAKILKTFGTPVIKVGQFSNGEAVYQKEK